MQQPPHHPRIAASSSIMFGKPCIAGTRIPVEQVLRELGAGLSIEEVTQAHPTLTRDDVLAAQAYAADVLRHMWMATQPALLGAVLAAYDEREA